MQLAHVDWGVRPAKQWVCSATRRGSGWTVDVPRRVTPDGRLHDRLGLDDDGSAVLLGVDFVLGLPEAYARRAGIEWFPAFLRAAGTGRWAHVLDVAATPDEVSLERPFYPQRAVRGCRREDLAVALGVPFVGLYRRCERAHDGRGSACPLFWTVGGNQVGKASISGWRMLREVPPARLALWPFDGDLDALVAPGVVTVAETYPAEVQGHLGLPRSLGKRAPAKRRAAAAPLLAAMERLHVWPTPAMADLVTGGFGDGPAGEDPFDTLLGLLGLVEVVDGHRPPGAPDDPVVRRVEGWVLGQAAS